MAIMVLDIGGTAIKSALYNDGGLTDIKETPTEAAQGGAHVMERIKEIIREYQKEYSFERIGISTAGQVNPVRGEIIYANENIPGYTGMKIKEMMEQEFRVPTNVENDVNAAAIGEAAFGVGRQHKNFVCLTYGTGVGGAIFLDGKLYTGSSYSAGVFGAMVLHPEDRVLGKDMSLEKDMFTGCYEKYASVTALVNSALRVDASLTSGRKIFERLDEPKVKEVVDRWILEIIYGLTTVIHMLNPECVILGGGVMEQPYVLECLRKQLYQHIMPSYHHVVIEKAALGNRAGMLGAAVL